ncbi:hypothetical protein CLOP_g16030, partial [Closterium sp. NIES-67]
LPLAIASAITLVSFSRWSRHRLRQWQCTVGSQAHTSAPASRYTSSVPSSYSAVCRQSSSGVLKTRTMSHTE